MYDKNYLFGFKSNIDFNLLQMKYNKDKIDYFKNIWFKFNNMLEFATRHDNLSNTTKNEINSCKNYLTSFGFCFFNELDYSIFSDNNNIWILSLFDYVYNSLSIRLREKLIKIMELKIYKNYNINPNVLMFFISHPVFFNRYFVDNTLNTIDLETISLLGKILSPLDANVELSIEEFTINHQKCIHNSTFLFYELYKKSPDKIINFFYYILKQNEGKLRVGNQCYFVDNINTYNFVLNISVIISYILANIVDDENYKEQIYLSYKKTDIVVSNNSKLYWLLYEYYRITFYSLLQQNQNALIQSTTNPLLKENFDIYIKANNKYLNNSIYYETFFHYIYDLICSEIILGLDEEIISELLYYVDHLIDKNHNNLSVVFKRSIYRVSSNLLMNKQIDNPYIKIKLIKIIYLLEKFCEINPVIILGENYLNLYDRLINIYIYIDKLAGLDIYLEKFFYKTNILEIISANYSYKITNKQFLIILFNDIECIFEYLILSSKQLDQNNLNNIVYENYKKNCINYLSRLKLRILVINKMITENNELFEETDIKYHLIKYYYAILKNNFDNNSNSIKRKINNSSAIWDVFIDNIIKPFSITIDHVFQINNTVVMIYYYYADMEKYLKLMDIELGTNFNETLQKCWLEMKDTMLPDNLPELFLDPLLFTPIRNPVILPDSKIIIDREVIEAHLVENENDPFNRKPLTKIELDKYNMEEEQRLICIEFIQKRDNWIKTNHCQKYNATE
jgi:hypothetical protein